MALKQTLDHMIFQAQRKAPEPVRVNLSKGLTISIRFAGDLLFDVQLSRAKVFPSTREWLTVLDQWPGRCRVTKQPKSMKDSKLYHLQGQVQVIQVFVD